MSKIIDIHPHIISPDTLRYPHVALEGTERSGWSQTRPASFEQLQAQMDEAGVAKAALVQARSNYGYDNSYCADMAKAHPRRFTAVATVDMLAPGAAETIAYWHGRGVTGLRHVTGGGTMDRQEDWLADPRTFPAWEAAGALGMTICVQLRREGVPQMETVVRQFPRIRIVGDHLVKAPIAEGPPYGDCAYLFDFARYDNFYLKFSTINVRNSRLGKATPETFFPLLVKHFGASRLAWSSNFPASSGSLPQMVEEARSALACLSAADQDWVFHRTAELLYPSLAD